MLLYYSCRDNNNPIISDTLYTVKVNVVDSENFTPVEYASIKLGLIEDSTNGNGESILKNVNLGKQNLYITHNNYAEFTKEIIITKDTLIELGLSILYEDYFPLNIGIKTYNYGSGFSSGSPRPSSESKRSISTWDIYDSLIVNDTTIFKVKESRIDTVIFDMQGNIFNYFDTVNIYFDIRVDKSDAVIIEKFNKNKSFPRYVRSDAEHWKSRVDFSDQYNLEYIERKKDIGMVKYLKSGNYYNESTVYFLRE